MTAAGLLVDIAEDGRSAVELALTGRYDVVLMDVQMPFMDGLEATRVIRPLLPSLPIIAMTANVSIDDRIACLKAGMNDHLTKPIDPALLYATLMRYLDDRSPR